MSVPLADDTNLMMYARIRAQREGNTLDMNLVTRYRLDEEGILREGMGYRIIGNWAAVRLSKETSYVRADRLHQPPQNQIGQAR